MLLYRLAYPLTSISISYQSDRTVLLTVEIKDRVAGHLEIETALLPMVLQILTSKTPIGELNEDGAFLYHGHAIPLVAITENGTLLETYNLDFEVI